MLDEALGLFDDHFGDLDVPHRGLVEGRGDDLALHRALHVGDFLGALVDQEHDQIAFRMIGGDRLRDVLQEHRLAGSRRRDDQRALALADRRHNIDHPCGKVFPRRILDLELQPLVGIERRQIVKMNLVARFFRVFEIDQIDLEQREIALAFLWTADDAFDRIAGSETQAPDLRRRDIDVVGAGQIIGVRRAQEGETVLQDFDDAFADDLDIHARELLEDGEHQFLFAHNRGVFDLVFFSEGEKFGRRFLFEVFEFDFPHRGILERRTRRARLADK